MDRNLITHRIRDVSGNLSRLNNNLHAMNSLDIQRYPDNYETISTEAALRAEKIACQLRSLLYASTGIPKEEYLVKAGEAHGIEIHNDDGILEITLPRLLPRKKSKQSSLFMLDPPWGCTCKVYHGKHRTSFPRMCCMHLSCIRP